VKGRLQVKFLDYYHDDLYEWQDFHECVHFLLAGMAAESSVGIVTQARSLRPIATVRCPAVVVTDLLGSAR
jgi:hypothetical protein